MTNNNDIIKSFVLPLSLINDDMRKDNINFYFEICGLSSVYAYSLTKKGFNKLKQLKNNCKGVTA